MILVVFKNYHHDGEPQYRFFHNDDMAVPLAMLVFVTTFISQSKSGLWTLIKDFVTKRNLCTKLTLSLIHVILSLICISFFDFRIIQIQSTSLLMRISILFADITSLFFMESLEYS